MHITIIIVITYHRIAAVHEILSLDTTTTANKSWTSLRLGELVILVKERL